MQHTNRTMECTLTGFVVELLSRVLGFCIRDSVLQEDSISISMIPCCTPFGECEISKNAMPPPKKKSKQDWNRLSPSLFSLLFSNTSTQNTRKHQTLHINWKIEMSSHPTCARFRDNAEGGEDRACVKEDSNSLCTFVLFYLFIFIVSYQRISVSGNIKAWSRLPRKERKLINFVLRLGQR